MKHIFAVCAYKDSPYLESCLRSLNEQQSPSPILVCTATPSPFIAAAAEKFGARLCVNPGRPGIGSDWNFALAQAKAAGADMVTLCHQDDLYLPEYGQALKAASQRDDDLLIWFCGYGEKRGEQTVTRSKLLRIKRLLLWRMHVRPFQVSRFMKHRTLALGDPICCPSVSFDLRKLELPLFLTDMTTSLDWQTWERLARREGRFGYDPRVLMLHRIHEGSATTQTLEQGGRIPEDYAMFRKFWCAPVAKVLTRLYSTSEKSNQV